jgi:hypothetical protein
MNKPAKEAALQAPASFQDHRHDRRRADRIVSGARHQAIHWPERINWQ